MIHSRHSALLMALGATMATSMHGREERILKVSEETAALLDSVKAAEAAEAMAARTTFIDHMTISSEHLPDPCTEPTYPEPRNRRLKGHQRHEKRPFYYGVRRK